MAQTDKAGKEATAAAVAAFSATVSPAAPVMAAAKLHCTAVLEVVRNKTVTIQAVSVAVGIVAAAAATLVARGRPPPELRDTGAAEAATAQAAFPIVRRAPTRAQDS